MICYVFANVCILWGIFPCPLYVVSMSSTQNSHGKFVATTVQFPSEGETSTLCISAWGDHGASYVAKVVFLLLLVLEWLAGPYIELAH